MNMQDKEFDEAFRSKLDDLTIEPSGSVWETIDHRLDKAKRKRLLTPFLSVAASIVVLVVAGILFIPQKQAVNDSHPAKNVIAKTIPALSVLQNIKNANSKPVMVKQNGAVNYVNTAGARGSVAVSHPVKETKLSPANAVNTVVDTRVTIKAPELALIAAVQPKIKDAINPAVPDDATQLKTTDAVDRSTDFAAKPTLAAAQLPVTGKPVAIAKRKHTIRSFGDLVNVVVAKVDKRKDKIIEFTDTDDDEANITGVNLGILKIKKDEK
jgi:hypothetical protein